MYTVLLEDRFHVVVTVNVPAVIWYLKIVRLDVCPTAIEEKRYRRSVRVKLEKDFEKRATYRPFVIFARLAVD